MWRETPAPDWQYSAPSAKSGDLDLKRVEGKELHSVTIPVSKDNVIFGVRSMDRAGHKSLVVTPVVGR